MRLVAASILGVVNAAFEAAKLGTTAIGSALMRLEQRL